MHVDRSKIMWQKGKKSGIPVPRIELGAVRYYQPFGGMRAYYVTLYTIPNEMAIVYLMQYMTRKKWEQ